MVKRKAFTTEPDLGLPEWTEIGSETGLDPLGMARPSEIIYQGLLPGISTITVRLRYYSFLPWLLHTYISSGNTADPDGFFKFQRNAEAVFALIGMNDPYDGGLAGSNWASRILASTKGDVIDFAESAQSKKKGLLKNKNGALGGIYGPQLQEMGLITSSTNHKIKVPTERGTEMAKAFEDSLGPLAPVLKSAIKSGRIAKSDLDKLKHLKPSEIDPQSKEGENLLSVLLGLQKEPLPEDERRKDSLFRILNYANVSKSKPRDYDVRWHWFKALKDNDTLDPWLAYHVNDLLTLAYEALLKRSLEVMSAEPDSSATFEGIIQKVLAKPCENIANQLFLVGTELSDDDERTVQEISKLGRITDATNDETVVSAIKLIRRVLGWAISNKEDLNKLFLKNPAFHSISTELAFVQTLGAASVDRVMPLILTERILKRHLWVASRKFRGQKKYSFLFEPVDNGQGFLLRYRNSYQVQIGYPRISQAIQFLEDLKLLDDGDGLTDFGQKVLNAA